LDVRAGMGKVSSTSRCAKIAGERSSRHTNDTDLPRQRLRDHVIDNSAINTRAQPHTRTSEEAPTQRLCYASRNLTHQLHNSKIATKSAPGATDTSYTKPKHFPTIWPSSSSSSLLPQESSLSSHLSNHSSTRDQSGTSVLAMTTFSAARYPNHHAAGAS
jgi:hypothetical protein